MRLSSVAISTIYGCAPPALLRLAFVICLAVTGEARADGDLEAGQDSPPRPRVAWNDDWTRFQPWEYAATGAAWTQAFLVRFGAGVNRSRDTFSLDEHIVEGVQLHGSAGDIAGTIADIGYVGSAIYRLVDSTIVPGLVWGKSDVALQMTLIDLEAFALSAFVLWNAQLAYGRERPMYRDCPESAAQGVGCDNQDDNRYRSFIAGHTLIATTAAGLTCVHHAHLPLYGGGFADDAACAGMIGVALFVGVTRISLRKHYPTDTLLAWGIGTLAGYVVPSALHYGFGRSRERSATARRSPSPGTVRMMIVPGAGTTTTGATLAGIF